MWAAVKPSIQSLDRTAAGRESLSTGNGSLFALTFDKMVTAFRQDHDLTVYIHLFCQPQ